MKAGDVLINYKFRKQNGEILPKYIVLLNDLSGDNFHIFCLTTSNPRRNCDESHRCNSNDGYFYIGKIKDIFVEETYLFFDYFILNTDDTVNEMLNDGSCEYVGYLGENMKNQIRNCIKRCDVSKYNLNLIFN